MIIHFIGSSQNIDENLPYYETIVDVAHNNGAVLARDWLHAAYGNSGNKTSYLNDDKVDWTEVHRENLGAMSRSDILIIEATTYGFQHGFFISHAILHKKPVLVVARLDSKKHPLFGVTDKLLSTKQYQTKEELEKIVNAYIKANTIATKDLRFNFFIDRQIYNYLREVSYETGKNKSEIIRDLLEEEIDRKDA